MSQRIGRFNVSMEMFLTDRFHEVLSYMKFTPVRVEFLYERHAFEYIVESWLFDEIDKNVMTPFYTVNVTETDGALSVEVNHG